MRTTVGCGAILMVSCCGCCCFRVPTFGLWPDVDESAIQAELLARPIVVDHLCMPDERCEVVTGADIDVVPVGWNPFTGTVVSLVAVEARCTSDPKLVDILKAFTCAGVLAAVGTRSPLGVQHEYLTWDTDFGIDMSSTSGGGSDHDHDIDFDWD